ncbi:hypothetical protein [Deinococcus aquatilis]|uniref:hypothetical protein n=1 Tax=Deinococcus aquatilis TaxID=519440 RepID=UPI0003A28E2B|nr:hypothetical protein [Deinococcus aquatilis]
MTARTLLLAALCGSAELGTADAQATPAPKEPVTVWGSLSTEFFILPSLSAGVSVGVGQAGPASLSVRGMADLTYVPLPDVTTPLLPLIGADLLFSGLVGNLTVYGGPGVGTLLGQAFWVSGTAGLRNTFGNSRWGFFSEVRGRYAFDLAGNGFLSPGTRLGLTYRF